jgi:gliding motility-associated-like protein
MRKVLQKAGLFFFVIILMTHKSFAQLCTGSLGDPVVEITFGAGNNPGPAITAATTSYQYVSGQCPNDGQYTIANSTSGCFGNSWHTISNDHTGNTKGYFMLVNASFQPGDFYVGKVSGLCPNTTYEFAAWITNMLVQSACGGSGIQPNVTFSIETSSGAVLGSYNTNDIPPTSIPKWTQYGFYFTTTTGETDVVLRMRNNAPGGCGNDLALDDITFRPCGPLVTTSIAGNTGSDSINVCQFDNTNFTFNANVSSGYNSPSYQWQLSTDNSQTWNDIPGANSVDYVRLATIVPGNYKYRMNVADGNNISLPSCRISSDIITVMVTPRPVPEASATNPACIGDTLFLTASTGINYEWTGPGNFTQTISNGSSPSSVYIPNASAANSGKYYVTVTNSGGCANIDSVTVTVNPKPMATVSGDITICKGSSTTLVAGGGVDYLWSPSIGLSATNIADPQASPDTATTYKVIVHNQFGCVDSASLALSVLITPIANAGPDKKIMEGQSVMLDGSTNTPDITVSWIPVTNIDDPSSLTPTVTPDNDITYTLQLISTVGCGVATDNVFVRVLKKITVPNAFSPNGDGINDVWNIRNLVTYPESSIQVFNRYGQVVFEANGYAQPWDGRYNGNHLPGGTYYYVIDLKNNLPKLSGWVFIVY